jgi:hypothetical protein
VVAARRISYGLGDSGHGIDVEVTLAGLPRLHLRMHSTTRTCSQTASAAGSRRR